MITTIFTLMASIGLAIFITSCIFILNGKTTKKIWSIWTASQVFVLPLATYNVIEEKSAVFKIVFVVILTAVIIGIYYLSKDEKKK